jgi:prepilin-type N-terminal cleavage/methylation domain-containing protein
MDDNDVIPTKSAEERRPVMNRHMQRLRRLRSQRRNNQKGFTLIELLVVISILGILAAVVTMSMVGITQLAQQRAASAEQRTIQLAVDTMANEQQVPEGQICADYATPPGKDGVQDMTRFPSGTDSARVGSSPGGKPVSLYPRYLRQQTTYGIYSCDGTGTVTQHHWSPP